MTPTCSWSWPRPTSASPEIQGFADAAPTSATPKARWRAIARLRTCAGRPERPESRDPAVRRAYLYGQNDFAFALERSGRMAEVQKIAEETARDADHWVAEQPTEPRALEAGPAFPSDAGQRLPAVRHSQVDRGAEAGAGTEPSAGRDSPQRCPIAESGGGGADGNRLWPSIASTIEWRAPASSGIAQRVSRPGRA